MKKVIKSAVAGMMCMAMMAGCGTPGNDEEKAPLVSVAQIVEHTSLNEIRDSFKEEMEALGYKEGENIRYDFKDAGNDLTTANSIMSTFAGNKSDVIVAIATPTAAAAANYSQDIPIIFSAVSDPIGSNLLTDMNKPDKNITGTSDEVQIDKIIELATKIDPELKKLGFLYNPGEANSVTNLEKAKKYCAEHDIELVEKSGTNISELQSAISVLCDETDAILAPNDNTVASSMAPLVETANKKKVPVYTGADSMVKDGGFATVGISYTDLGHETAKMVDQILKGEKVENIPVKVFNTELSTYVNKKTMDALGIELPDEVKNDNKFILIEE